MTHPSPPPSTVLAAIERALARGSLQHAAFRELLGEARDAIRGLMDAIRAHRDERGDDRCWVDDYLLYWSLGEDIPLDLSALPPKEEFLRSCERFWHQRQCPLDSLGADRMTIAQLQAEVERLRAEVKRMRAEVDGYEGFRVGPLAGEQRDAGGGLCPATGKPGRDHRGCRSGGHTMTTMTTTTANIRPGRLDRREVAIDPMALYLREIDEVPLLTADEEKMLARRIAGGDEAARDRLIRANLRFVVSVAKRYLNRGLSLQDLIQEGNAGLCEAVGRFDPDFNLRFSTYAACWIRKYIRLALTGSRFIWVERNAVADAVRVARGEVFDDDGRQGRAEQALKAMRMRRAGLQARSPSSRDQPQVLPVDPASDPVEQVDRSELLDWAIAQLPANQAEIVRVHYGLGGARGLPFRSIGRALGRDKKSVQRTESRAIKKLRRLLGRELGRMEGRGDG